MNFTQQEIDRNIESAAYGVSDNPRADYPEEYDYATEDEYLEYIRGAKEVKEYGGLVGKLQNQVKEFYELF